MSLASHVSKAMEIALSYSSPVESMVTLANMMREEALQYRDWKFEKDLSDFECPPNLFSISSYLVAFLRRLLGNEDASQTILTYFCFLTLFFH